MAAVTIPNGWAPRDYQMPLWDYLADGGKRAVAVWHRRAGKDSLSLNWTAVAALERVGTYWHMLPTAKQGRKVIWDARDRQGRRVIDQAFPMEIRRRDANNGTNNSEMKIELVNGSLWQVVGSDNYDSLVGSNPVGVVFSEYSVANPAAWQFIRPILAENGGWAVFIYTPRGKNHGYKLFQIGERMDSWFSQIMPLTESKAYSLDIIEEERESGMPEEMIEQEYLCSFDAAVMGAYYGKHIKQAKEERRVGVKLEVPWESEAPVGTAWDLGVDDYTAIWFYQLIGREIRIIDYMDGNGVGLDVWIKRLREKPYAYGERMQLFPHDITVREMSTGRSRQEFLERQHNFKVTPVPKLSVEDGIQAGRSIFSRCWFDKGVFDAVETLALYRCEWDEKLQTPKSVPVHDWTSHCADAWRTLAVGLRQAETSMHRAGQMVATQAYDPFAVDSDGFGQQVAVSDYDVLDARW